jgi:hypothetical protein
LVAVVAVAVAACQPIKQQLIVHDDGDDDGDDHAFVEMMVVDLFDGVDECFANQQQQQPRRQQQVQLRLDCVVVSAMTSDETKTIDCHSCRPIVVA